MQGLRSPRSPIASCVWEPARPEVWPTLVGEFVESLDRRLADWPTSRSAEAPTMMDGAEGRCVRADGSVRLSEINGARIHRGAGAFLLQPAWTKGALQ